MVDVPRPGMPQSEKDRLGQLLRDAEAAGHDAEAIVTDEQLDGLTKPQLLAEAERRGVQVPSGATKDDILAALRGEQTSEPEGEEG